MKKIFLILFLFYSTAIFSNTSIEDYATNIKIENLNDDLQIAFPFGALKNIFRGAGRGSKIIKNPGSKNMLKTGDDFFSSKPLKPYTKIQKSSFDWGFNPNPAAIKRGLKEMREFDPEGYDELSKWDCPDHIKKAPFMNDLDAEQRCVSYQMRCNVVVNTNVSAGSGFFINSRTVITNYHVVKTDSVNIKIRPFTDFKDYEGTVIAYNQQNDFAAIKLESYQKNRNDFFENNAFKSCKLSEKNPNINSEVIAIGHPDNRQFSLTKGTLEKYLTRDFKNVIGIKVYNIIDHDTNQVLGHGDTYSQAEAIANDLVATKGGRYTIKGGGGEVIHWIQMNAYISHGSSGGPLYHKGWVIGVNTGSYNSKKIAIHYKKLKNFLDDHKINNRDSNFLLPGSVLYRSILLEKTPDKEPTRNY